MKTIKIRKKITGAKIGIKRAGSKGKVQIKRGAEEAKKTALAIDTFATKQKHPLHINIPRTTPRLNKIIQDRAEKIREKDLNKEIWG